MDTTTAVSTFTDTTTTTVTYLPTPFESAMMERMDFITGCFMAMLVILVLVAGYKFLKLFF